MLNQHQILQGAPPGEGFEGRVGAPSPTLLEVLRMRAAAEGSRTSHTFVSRDGEIEAELTYAQLDRRARVVAHALHAAGAQPGAPVLVMVESALAATVAFYGCLNAGALAVPVPMSVARSAKVAEQSGTALMLVDSAGARAAREVSAVLSRPCSVLEIDPGDEHEVAFAAPTLPDLARPALLQYTSGSTGRPKGVMVSHANLIHLMGITERTQCYGQHTRLVSWLPWFHDLGLIAGLLQPVFSGFPAAILSPRAFLSRPRAWLEWIGRLAATSSAAPNFALDLCVRRIPAAERAGLDLSSLDTLVCAGEPVMAETLARFCAAYGPHGLRREVVQPAYGLAEATLQVTMAPRRQGYRTARFQAEPLRRGLLCAQDGAAESTTELVSCGVPVQSLAIVVPDTSRRAEPGMIGEIWVRSAAVASGYWRDEEHSRCTFQAQLADDDEGTYLRTGDLGAVHRGELFVAGRAKDLIIIRGENHYPQDIEHTLHDVHRAIRAGGCVAFSVAGRDGEELVVVAEVSLRGADSCEDVLHEISGALADRHGLRAHIVLVEPGSVAKTTSGKLQRSQMRESYLACSLEPLATRRLR